MGYLQAYIEAEREQRTKKENVPEDVREAMEERSAIMEIDGGLPREEADRRAYCLCVCRITALTAMTLCGQIRPCPRLEGRSTQSVQSGQRTRSVQSTQSVHRVLRKVSR